MSDQSFLLVMYTLYEAHDLTSKFNHLVGRFFFRAKDGLFYEIVTVLPAPVDANCREKMLEICSCLANSPETTEGEVLGEFIDAVEGEFEVVAVGISRSNGVLNVHFISLPFHLGVADSTLNMGCDYVSYD